MDNKVIRGVREDGTAWCAVRGEDGKLRGVDPPEVPEGVKAVADFWAHYKMEKRNPLFQKLDDWHNATCKKAKDKAELPLEQLPWYWLVAKLKEYAPRKAYYWLYSRYVLNDNRTDEQYEADFIEPLRCTVIKAKAKYEKYKRGKYHGGPDVAEWHLVNAGRATEKRVLPNRGFMTRAAVIDSLTKNEPRQYPVKEIGAALVGLGLALVWWGW
jgi:hypothetical protein